MTRGEEIQEYSELKMLKDLSSYYMNNLIIETLISRKEEIEKEGKSSKLRLKLKLYKLVADNSKSFFCVRT